MLRMHSVFEDTWRGHRLYPKVLSILQCRPSVLHTVPQKWNAKALCSPGTCTLQRNLGIVLRQNTRIMADRRSRLRAREDTTCCMKITDGCCSHILKAGGDRCSPTTSCGSSTPCSLQPNLFFIDPQTKSEDEPWCLYGGCTLEHYQCLSLLHYSCCCPAKMF